VRRIRLRDWHDVAAVLIEYKGVEGTWASAGAVQGPFCGEASPRGIGVIRDPY
jgi:hypothetical protein